MCDTTPALYSLSDFPMLGGIFFGSGYAPFVIFCSFLCASMYTWVHLVQHFFCFFCFFLPARDVMIWSKCDTPPLISLSSDAYSLLALLVLPKQTLGLRVLPCSTWTPDLTLTYNSSGIGLLQVFMSIEMQQYGSLPSFMMSIWGLQCTQSLYQCSHSPIVHKVSPSEISTTSGFCWWCFRLPSSLHMGSPPTCGIHQLFCGWCPHCHNYTWDSILL